MAKKKIDVDTLWQIAAAGAPCRCRPTARRPCCGDTPLDARQQEPAASMWLLSTLGGVPRALTQCGDKDGQPAVVSPRGDLDRLRRQARAARAARTTTPQLYVIAPDGGEARRVGRVATGVEGFRWFPDGKRIAFVSWVWPELKGAAAQAKRLQGLQGPQGNAATPPARRCTASGTTTLPMGRVPHLHVMDVASGRVRDLFEGTRLRARTRRARAASLRHRARRAAHRLRVRPGRREAPGQPLRAGRARAEERSRRRHRARRRLGPARAALQPRRHARRLPRQPRGPQAHHARPARRVGPREQRWEVESAEWDHEVKAPLLWEDDGQALLLHGRAEGPHAPVALRPARPPRRGAGRRRHRARLRQARRHAGHARRRGRPSGARARPACRARRRGASSASTTTCSPGSTSGATKRCGSRGALGDACRCGCSTRRASTPKKQYPLLHIIHGGPHTAPGDGWHYRWNNQVFAAQGYVVAASTTTARRASATPSSTRSPTAGASWSCRTSRPPPTGC